MIPGNIELTDEVLAKISSDPILLRWFSSIQSQLVTSTIEENGVGCTRIVWNDTGSTIESLQEVDADDGLELGFFNSSGSLSRSFVQIEGVWVASSGPCAPNTARMMTRIS